MKTYSPWSDYFEEVGDPAGADEYAKAYTALKKVMETTSIYTITLALTHLAWENYWSKRYLLERIEVGWNSAKEKIGEDNAGEP